MTMSEKQIGRIAAVSISRQKGTPKTNVPSAKLIRGHGMDGDAHAGNGHRQISLLALENIEETHVEGILIRPGMFAENIATTGIDFALIRVTDRIAVGDCLLEITQLGKECHDRCAIYERAGECVMQNQGVFAIVLEGGQIKTGDPVIIIPNRA
jgi:MOSC domain-containing protein YiiM